MAKILTEMPKKAGGPGRTAIYPYDEWLDGQIRQLDEGDDYNAKPQSVVASIRTMAENRGKRLRTRFVKNDDGKITGIVIQAFEPEQESTPEPVVVPKSNRRPRTKSRA